MWLYIYMISTKKFLSSISCYIFDLIYYVIGYCFYLVMAVLCTLVIRNTYKLVSPHNRRMNIGFLWLIFLPIAVPIFCFVFTALISKSIVLECKERGMTYRIQPTLLTGIVTGAAYCLCFNPYLNHMGIVTIICFIIYMIEMVIW